ncbi:MAG: VOC family protein [Gammaproteobacteria bacterium]|nr:VOC family protein [Gammaproteobacteria bacterium]MCF6230386.1 VOC family protein [Gammaproteobacteria bacterium]
MSELPVRPKPTGGMRHVALFLENFEACEQFYTELMGMKLEWRPDPDNLYLTSGNDNLALHRAKNVDMSGFQRLDHIGFIIESPEQVQVWYDYLLAHDVKMKTTPRQHRDGAHSFYCFDPDGNTVQIIYHPPIS